MRIETVRGIAVARLTLEDVDAQLLDKGDILSLKERVIKELSSVVDRDMIERPLINVSGDTLEVAFALSLRRNVIQLPRRRMQ